MSYLEYTKAAYLVHYSSTLSLTFSHPNAMQELLLSVLCADDVGLASERAVKLQEVFDKWKNILEDHGLRVSESKTEYMFLPFSDPQAPSPDIMINGNVMPKCKSFKYLGSIINKTGSCDEDVNHRISVAWLNHFANVDLSLAKVNCRCHPSHENTRRKV